MSQTVALSTAHDDDVEYKSLEKLIAGRVATVDGPILVTGAHGLFDEFLKGLPADRRQSYRCNCCRRFIERFGAAVRVDDDGDVTTLLWEPDGVPEFFREAVARVRTRVVDRFEVAGVLVNDQGVWGDPKTGNFTHLHGAPKFVFRGVIKTGAQAAAEKAEEFRMISLLLAEFKRETVEQAVRVLEADAVSRSEKAVGAARWLLALHDLIGLKAGERKNNLVWRAAATAPPGFAHSRSNMLGTLLEDLRAGTPFDEVQRKWASKVDPAKFMRPTKVTAGNVARAEQIVEQLKSAGSLNRRFAKLTDVNDLWMPREPESQNRGGVFGRVLETKKVKSGVTLPPVNITWEKFEREVLEGALKIDVLVPRMGNFFGITVAADPDAPPIIQWDTEPRNTACCYVQFGGPSPAANWGLQEGTWQPVTAIYLNPPHWYEPEKFTNHTRAVMLAIQGCKDQRDFVCGGLFPETLRNEYHEIRSTVEAFVKGNRILGQDEGDANGIVVGIGQVVTIQVTTQLGTATYNIDRMD